MTGCSQGGIGHEICLSFHRRGYKVFASARRLEGLPEAIERVKMDVTDVTSIERGLLSQESTRK